jgi:hypothetical protein
VDLIHISRHIFQLNISIFSFIRSLKAQLPYAVTLNQDRSVSVRTKLGVELSMICFRTRGPDTSLLQRAQTDPGAHTVSYLMGTGGFSPRGKATGAWR